MPARTKLFDRWPGPGNRRPAHFPPKRKTSKSKLGIWAVALAAIVAPAGLAVTGTVASPELAGAPRGTAAPAAPTGQSTSPVAPPTAAPPTAALSRAEPAHGAPNRSGADPPSTSALPATTTDGATAPSFLTSTSLVEVGGGQGHTQSPRTRSPGTQSPSTQSPGTQSPGTQSPGTQSPGAQSPGAQSPGTPPPPVATSLGPVRSFAGLNDPLTITAGPDATSPPATTAGALGTTVAPATDSAAATTVAAATTGGAAGTTVAAAATAAPAGRQSWLIPAYQYPTSGPLWTTLATTRPATLPSYVIANVGSGPGTTLGPTYAAAVSNVEAEGWTVVGYVDTAEATVPLTTAEAQVSAWGSLYGVDDIFFDDVTGTSAGLAYYEALTHYVHGLGGIDILNPGTPPSPGYLSPSAANAVVVMENTLAAFQSSPPPDYSSSAVQIGYIITSGPTEQDLPSTLQAIKALGGNLVYVTDQGDGYSSLPSYFATENSAMAATSVAPTVATTTVAPTTTAAAITTVSETTTSTQLTMSAPVATTPAPPTTVAPAATTTVAPAPPTTVAPAATTTVAPTTTAAPAATTTVATMPDVAATTTVPPAAGGPTLREGDRH